MPQTTPTHPLTGEPSPALVEELERRIATIEATDASEVGRFTRLDWMICVGGAVVAPALAMWWFAG